MSMIDFTTAVAPFEYQVLAHVDRDHELLATMNGAYINLWRWDGEAWHNFDCIAASEGASEGIGHETVATMSERLTAGVDAYLYPWQVSYHSAGCLPDSEPARFATLEDAREHVRDEWENLASDCEEWLDIDGTFTDAAIEAIEAIESADGEFVVDDPRPGSPYRWEVCEA